MAANLPYEVKRLIYGHVDFETLKSLRLVSMSWATVGLELLFLPSFIVKSYSIDIPRLINIGASADVSRQAARVIRTIKFHTTDWDASYLRSIFCSRHAHLSNYEVVDFVPTREEQQALEELDVMIDRRTLDDVQERDRDLMIRAFRQTPQVNAVEVTCPNPFKHRLLRKVWDEYAMETYRSSKLHHGSSQLVDILFAARGAGLEIQHIGDHQLTSYFFTGEDDLIAPQTYAYLNRLKSLRFTICDVPFEFLLNNVATTRLCKIISASPELENIYLKFESLFPVSLDFLPAAPPITMKLRTLSLIGVSLETARLFSFLEMQVSTLRYLSIHSAELAEGSGTWRGFIAELKGGFGATLEKFELAGVLKTAEAGGETWLLLPIYKAEDWTELVYSGPRNSDRTKDVENFVLKDGPWPMTDEDDISSLLV